MLPRLLFTGRLSFCASGIHVQWFASIDIDRSGELDVKELQRALSMGNLHFGISDVDQMIRWVNAGPSSHP